MPSASPRTISKRSPGRRRLELHRLPLAPSQRLVLEALCRDHVFHSSQELAEMTQVDQATVWVVAHRLRDLGLVESKTEIRRTDSGRKCRVALIKLTEDGLKFSVNFQAFVRGLGPRLADRLRVRLGLPD